MVHFACVLGLVALLGLRSVLLIVPFQDRECPVRNTACQERRRSTEEAVADLDACDANARLPGAASTGAQAYGTPVRMLSQAAVGQVPDPVNGRLGGARGTVGVQIMVPAEQVERVIGAVDQQARFTLVPSLSAAS